MEIFLVILIILLMVLISTGLILKKKKVRDFLGSSLITIYLLLLMLINLPTFITNIGENQNELIKFVYFLYESSPIIFILISNIIVNAFIPLFYKLLVNNTSSKKEVCNEFNEFCRDATELIVTGNDLNFLLDEKYSVQKRKIMGLRNKCKILCQNIERPTNFSFNSNREVDKKYELFIKLYKELNDSGVNIKCFPHSTPDKYKSLKKIYGQIKTTCREKSAKIVAKSGTKFENINFNSMDLVTLLEKNIEELHNISNNPILKCVAIDIGNVSFKKNVGKFCKYVAELLKIDEERLQCDEINFNEELYLGNENIIELLENILNSTITRNEKIKIINYWNHIWEPNEEILNIAKKMTDRQYEVVFISNINTNGNNISGYLTRIINKYVPKAKYFFVCQERKSRSDVDRNYFQWFEEKFLYFPWQILLIDDLESNINNANKSGWDTIRFDNSAMKRQNLVDELSKKSINVK